MVGRTPEYLGKKIEAYDVKMAMLYVLIFPLVILVLTAISVLSPNMGLSRPEQHRPARADAKSSTPSTSAPATTAPPLPASTPTPTGTTSLSASRCSPAAS